MQSLRTVALGAALIVGITSAAAAQQPRDKEQRRPGTAQSEGRHMGARLGRALFRGIDLTDQQRTQIRSIAEKYRPQRQEIWKSTRREGERRQRPDSTTMAQIRALTERQHAEIRAVLTPAQQPAFDENVARLRERGREMRGRRASRA